MQKSALRARPLAQQLLPGDPSFHIGRLANGLTYYLRRNTAEPGFADFCFVQRSGSLVETADERGLAHFVEHMAFHTSENFLGTPASPSLIERCEALGVGYGSGLNACTGVDRTLYRMAAVPTSPHAVETLLLAMHDISHALALRAEEMDTERAVIYEEWRTGRSGMAVQRMMQRVLARLYEGTPHADCLPIGSMDIVRRCSPARLRAFYEKWYRPDLQAVIIVGDIDPADIERRLRRTLAPIPLPLRRPTPTGAAAPTPEGLRVLIEHDKEQPMVLAHLYMVQDAPSAAEKLTVRHRRRLYAEALAVGLLNARLHAAQLRDDAPYLNAAARTGQFFLSREEQAFSLAFGCRQDDVCGAVRAVLTEAERVRQHGFTADEYDHARRTFAGKHARTLRAADRNASLVRRATDHFLCDEPLTDAAEEQRRVQDFVREVTVEEVNAAAARLVSHRRQVLVVYAPERTACRLPSADELARCVRRWQATVVPPCAPTAAAADGLPEPKIEGSIVEEGRGAHGTHTFLLDNGLRVWLKPTADAADGILLKLVASGGAAQGALLTKAAEAGGAGDCDAAALAQLLNRTDVRLRPFFTSEAHGLAGGCAATELPLLLRLLHARLAAPRTDLPAFERERRRTLSFLQHREANPQVAYNDEVARRLGDRAPAAAALTGEDLAAASYDALLARWQALFARPDRFTLILVGDIALDDLRPLLRRYAATWRRQPGAAAPQPTPNRLPAATGRFLLHRPLRTPAALVSIFHALPLARTAENVGRLDALCRLVQTVCVKAVRCEQGGTYAVQVSGHFSPAPRQEAVLSIVFRCAPERHEQLMAAVDDALHRLATETPKAADVRALQSVLRTQAAQDELRAKYWLRTLCDAALTATDFHTPRRTLIDRLTPAALRRLTADFLTARRRLEVTLLPT